MRKLIAISKLVLIFSCSFFQVQAQLENPIRTDLIPPSPTAANLGRYGDVPVTHYTGMANVSIPIFTVAGNDLSLPITLTYNYSGFKPSQEASWIGLGWSLQAGGVITRTIGDKVDGHLGAAGDYTDEIFNLATDNTWLKNAYQNAMYDTQPDIYSFNFGSYSGKFIKYKDKFYVTPFQKLKITGNTGANGFTIITEDGVKYEFGSAETTVPKNSFGAPYTLPVYNSAWYLTKITNPSGTESIRLEYVDEGEQFQYGVKSQTYREFQSGYGEIENSSTLFPASISFPTKIINSKRLSRIISKKHIIDFNPEINARNDIDGNSRALHSISVISSDQMMIKSYYFEHDYFGTGSHGTTFLKLKALSERSSGSNLELKHLFEYENENDTFGTGFDSSVDHFGYLNSPGSFGFSFIPTPIYPIGPSRTPNFNYTKYGALKKITYPTDGSTEFEYEPNILFSGKNYLKVGGTVNLEIIRPVSISDLVILETSEEFSINYNQTIDLTFSRIPKVAPFDEHVNHDNQPELKLERLYYVDGEVDVIQNLGVFKILFNVDNPGKTIPMQLDAGIYRITIYCDKGETTVSAYTNYKNEDQNVPLEGSVGEGIRIKKISSFPNEGSPIIKKYSYKNDEGFSTGIGRSNPSYSSKQFSISTFDPYAGEIARAVYVQHTSNLSEGYVQGLPWMYKFVTEELVAGEEQQRTSFFYKLTGDLREANLIKKVVNKKLNDHFIPIHKSAYSYKEVTDTVFNGISIYLAEQVVYTSGNFGTGGIYGYDYVSQPMDWNYLDSSIETKYEGTDSLVTKTINIYDDVTRNVVGKEITYPDDTETYIKYKYPEDYITSSTASLVNAHVLSPIIEEQVWKKNNSGDSIMVKGTINKYNTLAKVSRIYSFESNIGADSLTSETQSSGKYNTLISDNRYAPKIDFDYNDAGDLVSQKLTNNTTLSYIWGYPSLPESGSSIAGFTLPIAEIKNALPSEVFYQGFEDIGQVQDAKAGKKSFAGLYTISASFTGNYTLTYWKKTGTGEWELIEDNLVNPSNIQIGSADSFIDEIRLYPVHAMLTTFTHQPGIGVTSIADANNQIQYFEYDSLGRLKAIKDFTGVLRTFMYHYKNEIVGTIPIVD
ncbi:hypothetical protein SanaruYs_26240 [Chryseotalea sanaruensis]|uniref:YD repeat-containing protein n=1 Tax=Chryseotalea sanaruensis TaxID=2482724 RepID=A0A401UBX7_9BACT|nr:hypothetical protein [Chryseotalea sanaruensis]GCC52387.1 hypothetical protein SanaruYs_26240 [Chryseotalea sanaruensis]